MAENIADDASQAMAIEAEPAAASNSAGTAVRRTRRSRPAPASDRDPRIASRPASPPPAAAPAAASAPNPARFQRELRDFASARPQGWGHEDWINFLESLQGRGYDIQDRDAIGVALERERLDLALSSVKGLGPQRRRALVERFGHVWTLRNANPAEIAEAARIPVDLAAAARDAVAQ
jgi:hypothetical protein